MDDKILDILVPTEEVVEVRKGTKVNTERKFFPGYILVKMVMTDDAWHLIKNNPKVTNFWAVAISRFRLQKLKHSGLLPKCRKVLNGRRRWSILKSASRSAFATVRLLLLSGWLKKWTWRKPV